MAENKDMKDFICTGCGKTITLTKFASQKTCKCEDCKTNNVPINPAIVEEALSKNPPRERKKVDGATPEGNTKIRPCIKCGAETEVSKFMSDQKVLCDDCKGVTTNSSVTKGTPRIQIDISKLDRSKIQPVQEYEVNGGIIANKNLREVKCPACHHEYMRPLSIVDWSIYGLVITYQCPKCYLVETITEQTKRKLSQFSPSVRFDYTGTEMKDLNTSKIESTRLSNTLKIVIDKLKENNIELEGIEMPPYRHTNDMPVPVGFVIPERDKWVDVVNRVAETLHSADRIGNPTDDNTKNIVISETLAKQLAKELGDLLKE